MNDRKYRTSEEVRNVYYGWKDENPKGAAPRKENGVCKFTLLMEHIIFPSKRTVHVLRLSSFDFLQDWLLFMP